MKLFNVLLCSGLTLLAASAGAFGTVRYVDANSVTPAAPYTNWAGAARVIQNAIDVASAGDEIVVTNGIYNTGGRAVSGTMTNRVAVTKPLLLRSVNGPQYTIIGGYQVPGLTNGTGAIRCVYLTNNATLSGFTLTNGATSRFGAESEDRWGGGVFCVSTNAVISNCVFTGNSAAERGGGVYRGTLNNCTLIGNLTFYDLGGGGAFEATLNNSILAGNSALNGGGAWGSTLNNCTVISNSAILTGGGTVQSTLNNCVLSGNSASEGGGAYDGTLNNCTVTGNWATNNGGGVVGTLTNCIVYYNVAPLNANGDGFLDHCCTTPLPNSGFGFGNIVAEPELASLSHLSANSPCLGKGNFASISGVDIDGEPWANPPSIGCDEYISGSATGALSVTLAASYTNVAVGFSVNFHALISGRVIASRWEFGDGTVVSNRPFASHAWSVAGDFPVILRAYNESYPAGVTATVTVHVVTQPVHHVLAGNLTPVPPYLSWATAATNIQDAVDAASIPGALVLVTNGTYASGGTSAGRVFLDKYVVIQSVNGPQFTVINGGGTVRCAWLANGNWLSGFTLTNGSASDSGGGVFFGGAMSEAVVSNCVIVGNSAAIEGGGAGSTYQFNYELRQGGMLVDCLLSGNSSVNGGGAAGVSLINCTVMTNSANSGAGVHVSRLNNCKVIGNATLPYGSGGGASASTLDHCSLTANSAWEGGGAYGSTLNNCTVANNSVGDYYGGGVSYCTLNNCVVTGNRANAGGSAGAFYSTLNNCTVTGNSAKYESGGVNGCTLTNCIVYYNSTMYGEANYSYSTFDHCCTTPLPTSGFGNLTTEPQLANNFRLSASSVCRGKGNYFAVSGVDIDGDPWAKPPAIGCDEYYSGSITGALTVACMASFTNVAIGFSVNFEASIQGRVSASRWEFGDGTVVSNRPFASHAWTLAGDYAVVLRAYNQDNPSGVTATINIHVADAVHYVDLNSASPSPPYDSWAIAATNIQDAIDAASTPGALVLVTNGVYETGGRAVFGTMTNRVAVDRILMLRSVNGPQFTFIQGYQLPGITNGDGAIRCVYLTSGATLSGFTLTNGATRAGGDPALEQSGGGLWCEFSAIANASNCVVAGNSANRYGGGVYGGSLVNCQLVGNSAVQADGGGVFGGMLANCQLVGNSAAYGGGASSGTLSNCTLTANSAVKGGGGAYQCTMDSCTLNCNWGATNGGGVGGGSLNNCLLTDNSATYGGGASGGTLIHCTLSNNWAGYSGGGAFFGSLTNCTITANTAEFGGGVSLEQGNADNCIITGNSATWAGGAYAARLNNCLLAENQAFWGGGAYYSTLLNCTLAGNSAEYGGGDYYGTLTNCIIYFNDALVGENHWNSLMNFCCTLPLPASGLGNIPSDPRFVDLTGGNLRLQSNSPCINSSAPIYTPNGPDLDGDPRVVGGTVDIGAYELQSPASVISYAWLQQYGLPTDGSVDFTDADSDRLNNWQEWIAGTAPTDPTSALRLLNPARSASGITVTWESVSNRTYFLERATTLGGTSSFVLLTNNISGQSGTTHYTDINALGPGPFFYRVGIKQ